MEVSDIYIFNHRYPSFQIVLNNPLCKFNNSGGESNQLGPFTQNYTGSSEGPAIPAVTPITSWDSLLLQGIMNLAFHVFRRLGRKERKTGAALPPSPNLWPRAQASNTQDRQEMFCLYTPWGQNQGMALGACLVWLWVHVQLQRRDGVCQWVPGRLLSQGLINGEEQCPGSRISVSCWLPCGPPNEVTCLFGWCRVTQYLLIKKDSNAGAARGTWWKVTAAIQCWRYSLPTHGALDPLRSPAEPT